MPTISSWRQKSGDGIMVWGAFSCNGYSRIAFLHGAQKSLEYCGTIHDHLLPFADEKRGDVWLYQSNNAQIHNSSEALANFYSNNVRVTPWLTLSLYLIPIENLWRVLSQRVFQMERQFDTMEELRKFVEEEWNKFEDDLRHSLVTSMTSRCIATLEDGGKNTKH